MLKALKRLWSATETDFVDESLWSPSGWSEAATGRAESASTEPQSIHESLRSKLEERAPEAANSDLPIDRVA